MFSSWHICPQFSIQFLNVECILTLGTLNMTWGHWEHSHGTIGTLQIAHGTLGTFSWDTLVIRHGTLGTLQFTLLGTLHLGHFKQSIWNLHWDTTVLVANSWRRNTNPAIVQAKCQIKLAPMLCLNFIMALVDSHYCPKSGRFRFWVRL